ncbi:hypothetical protein [Psychroserpens ponticola]|uniref:GLPGLI family protein n=1 Tax=Psychroserpens ponticola TaxID=2932268 RepID=A0ABY7S0E3_9FLAO|nr:hypothetical protein [Psychroserpens ponticola]WCO02629.1 hypothetical protein MUN68_003830 [Psychroserpens ponticola]
MKLSLFLCFLCAITTSYSQGQNKLTSLDSLFYPNYPDGIYETKADFLSKTPSNNEAINALELVNLKRIHKDSLPHNCFFFYDKSRSKIRNVFAIVHNGQTFFQIKTILKHRNKNDRAQQNSKSHSFVRVIFGGNNYLYTEVNFRNKWKVNPVLNTGMVGGLIYSNKTYGKGVVWDFKNDEFNIFKSCKDYNNFIVDKLPEMVQECKSDEPNNFKVREAIQIIK